MKSSLPNPDATQVVELEPADHAACAAPAAPAAMTVAQFLARMVPAVPGQAELAALHDAAERAKAAAHEAEERRQRLRAEIEAARTATQPRPDLVEAVAALTAAEIEARVRSVALPSDHPHRMAEARAAIASAESKRAESELLLPVLERLLADVDAEARRARTDLDRASAAYGTAAALSMAAGRYLPALAVVLEAQAEITRILDRWGGNVHVQTKFADPITGHDGWTLREVERQIEREIERGAAT